MEKLNSPVKDVSNAEPTYPAWLLVDKTKLRRPHDKSQKKDPLESPNELSDETSDETSDEIPDEISGEINSNLSADAAPWFPEPGLAPSLKKETESDEKTETNMSLWESTKVKEQTHSQHCAESSQQLDSSNVNNACSEDQQSSCIEEQETSAKEENSDTTILQELEMIICAITSNPGEFKTFIPGFVCMFWKEDHIRCLPELVKTIIDWSIVENNFRYNGARICACFDTMTNPYKRSLFRDILYYSCQMEMRLLEFEWKHDSTKYEKCHGLILFLAELVAQMDETFASSLGELLIEFIHNMLVKPTPHIVKYVCQALKLAGQRLEKDKSKIEKLENIMHFLSILVMKDDLQTGNMLRSVKELRNDNWGATKLDSFKTNIAPDAHSSKSNTTSKRRYRHSNKYSLDRHFPVPETTSSSVYEVYGPDGQIQLTKEEAEFLESHLGHDEVVLQELDIDQNYDDEIAAAYDVFCNISKTSKVSEIP